MDADGAKADDVGQVPTPLLLMLTKLMLTIRIPLLS